MGKSEHHVCAVLCPVCAVEYSMILAVPGFRDGYSPSPWWRGERTEEGRYVAGWDGRRFRRDWDCDELTELR